MRGLSGVEALERVRVSEERTFTPPLSERWDQMLTTSTREDKVDSINTEVGDMDNFDGIVIGSGIGGLTTAAILARYQGKRILVLEQHFTPGGFTHGFERQGKFHWDVGLHYVGGMTPGRTERRVFDYISNDRLQWQKMPSLFEKFIYPDFSFAVYDDPDRYREDLSKLFPQEKRAIYRYFRDVQWAALGFGATMMLELLPPWLQTIARSGVRIFNRLARLSTKTYLDRHFRDDKLKALLTSQWGDYGLPPSQSCFGVHSLIVTHYLSGAWYPVGGGKSIAQSIVPTIEAAGGKVITQRRVQQILLEGDRAVGVIVENCRNGTTETYYAPVIVSNAGAYNTYINLIPPDYPLSCRSAIKNFPKGSSMVTLYLGLKGNPQNLGFRGENHWIYSGYDHDQCMAGIPFQFAYLSFPSLKDPLVQHHTAEVISHFDYDQVAQWQEQTWRHRDQDYLALKQKITADLLRLVGQHYPSLVDIIAYTELSTPLTVAHFDNSDRGAVYGIPCIPERFEQDWIGSRTPIKNLYLTGTDAMSLGVVGAMMGGVKTAGIISGKFMGIMGAIHQPQPQLRPQYI